MQKVGEFVRVAQIGSSMGFRISRRILNLAGAQAGDWFELKVEGKNLKLERKK
jgi:antitoxin component of MazEF toxin-antitoxin module